MNRFAPGLACLRVRIVRTLAALALAAGLGAAPPEASIRELQGFLRSRPAHREAREQLLRLLWDQAEARTRALPGTGPLPPVQDLETWGPAAQELDRVLEDGSWTALDLGSCDPPLDARSPTLRALLSRHQRTVERALETLPESERLWKAWIRLGLPGGRGRGRRLLESLTPLPPEARLPWPPPAVQALLAPQAGGKPPARPGLSAAAPAGAVRALLAEERSALVLAVGPEPETLAGDLARLAADPDLLPLGLHFLAAAPGSALAGTVPTRTPFPPGKTAWALLGPGGVAGEGTGLPSAQDLQDAFDATACRPRLEALRTFALAQPQRLDAAALLLQEMAREGERATRRALGNEPLPLQPTGQREARRPRENHADLGEADDEALWAGYRDLLAQRLPELLPVAGCLPVPPGSLVPDCLWASPLLRAAARDLLAPVEAALAQRPTDAALWALWNALHTAADGHDLAALLASLQPSPLTPPGAFPPPGLRTASLREAREQGNWKALVAQAGPACQALLEAARTDRGASPLTEAAWEDLAEPLLEGLVRLHELTEADRLLKSWLALSPWRGAATAAQAIALDCGEEPLMQRWSELLAP